MENNLFPILLILLLGILMGGLIGWLVAKLKYATNSITAEALKANYVLKEIFDALQLQSDLYRDDLMDKEEHIRLLGSQLSTREQVIINQEEKLNHQQQEFAALQERSRIEFENIANRLLEEKSEKFTAKNQEQIQNILNPLREKIKDFEANMDKKFLEDTKDKISLKEEIKHLRVLNEQLSQDAGNLVAALKGDSKTQGDWGELRLELLLEKAGLTKNIHYLVQPSYRDENGKQKRPDFIINLPNDKHLIVDSKVSLKAYEKYFNADSKEKQDRHLKAHCDSLRKHIRDLASKNYQQLYQIHSPDYLLLFVPIEPAFTAATQADSKLFLEALDRNIVIVTTSTLLATMRTVSYIWKQEKQKRSVLEIARQSGLLYDKFVNFVEDLKQIGYRLDSTKSAYADAMNKLVDSRKFGDTLVGRAERIRELGARSSKRLPRELLDTITNQKIPTDEKPIQPQ